jgi:hypothetical protein
MFWVGVIRSLSAVAEVAEQLIELLDQTDIDGFNLTRTITPESHEDFIQYVIPEWQQRRRYKTAYADGTLRHKIFAQGNQLPTQHPARQGKTQTQTLSNAVAFDG